MLDNYYASGLGAKPVTQEQRQRLAVVQAALEITKAAVSASTAISSYEHVKDALKYSEEHINSLADAIEKALEVK